MINRQDLIQRAANETFDIGIIGGGASGAGCALDAQARGYKVVLIEKLDFGAATSSKSTKLVHGGVRYLEQAVKKLSLSQYKMVHKALKERKTLLAIAPHLTRPLQLVTPCRTFVESVYYYIGLKLYDRISGNANIGKSRLLSKKQALSIIPTLRKSQLYNAVSYYDGQMDDQRLNLAIIQTALKKGAVCLNHCTANSFLKYDGEKINALQAIDQLTGNSFGIKAKVFINATGPFSDAIRQMANNNLRSRIRVSKGVHIILPGKMINAESALLIPKTRDGRLVFAIPYNNRLLVGTTEDECALTTGEFGPTETEIDYLLEYANEYLDIAARKADVLAGFGGLRPLISSEGNTKDLVRDHEVEHDPVSGLVSILGGKWTTYRLMARDTIDKAAQLFEPQSPPKDPHTENIILEGGENFDADAIATALKAQGCEEDIALHLVSKYGSHAALIVEEFAGNPVNERLMTSLPFTRAELQYVISNEMACTVKDVLSGRWGIQLSNWQQTLALIPVVGEIMSEYFNWDMAQREQYIHQYEAEIKGMMQKAKL